MFIVECLFQQFNGDCDDDERRRRRSFSLEPPFFLGDPLNRQRGNLFENLVVRTLWLTCRMDSMLKGIYKGFKYTLSQLFVEKEEEDQELQIGGPTDVKHVSHIGWEGSTETAPSWMNEFKTGNDYAATSISNSGSALSPWSSRDFSESLQQSESDMSGSTDAAGAKKKERRKKSKSSSSPKTDTSKPSRPPGKSKQKLTEDKSKPTNIEVA